MPEAIRALSSGGHDVKLHEVPLALGAPAAGSPAAGAPSLEFLLSCEFQGCTPTQSQNKTLLDFDRKNAQDMSKDETQKF